MNNAYFTSSMSRMKKIKTNQERGGVHARGPLCHFTQALTREMRVKFLFEYDRNKDKSKFEVLQGLGDSFGDPSINFEQLQTRLG
jgi:hypothetical protein